MDRSCCKPSSNASIRVSRSAQPTSLSLTPRTCGRSPNADPGYLVDIRTEQAEYAGHTGMGRDPGQLHAHRFEHRPARLRTEIAQLQSILGPGVRIDDDRLREPVGEDVAAGLVEELVAERDVVAVDVMNFGDVADVRDAVRGTRRDRRGHCAVQAMPNRCQFDLH
jgi:hypothetical protein